MKWSRMELLQAKDATIEFDEMIRFEPEVFSKMHQIRGLQDVTVSGNVHYEASSERVFADLDIEGVMIVPCSITLEDVEYDFHTISLVVFSFEKTDVVFSKENTSKDFVWKSYSTSSRVIEHGTIITPSISRSANTRSLEAS